ncbi:DUF4954 family protein [Alistipes sp.]|uniref:DUF4954 family protein n=1 Tax=Alistipes sp. TaxID=1872444 RepID=UPI0025BA251B|nr:DUF4954 family protein [Alistipes sp.]
MVSFRKLTAAETAALEALGNSAEDWSKVLVSSDFKPSQLMQSRLEGAVEIGAGARIVRSRVANYRIGEGSFVEGVTALECRHRSAFGNGTGVATMNECGGRTVKISERMSAQVAYIMAVYRHRPQTIAALEKMIGDQAEERSSEIGQVGSNCRIVGARFIREVRIGNGVVIDGASVLQNATLCDGVHIGVDVKAYDLIAAEGSLIDNGATVERCFVGESCRLDKGFTAAESLFFANSHCENGEAASIFAGPYTVSHHKSSLLIAGMFSFFNAGSGSNQSNHLFKSGAVHQSVHLRGCKFASSAYIMSPALEGAFTMVMGHHSHHHDTSAFPYSYLIEKEGRSHLMPGANLTSFGAVRDIEKWPARDRRTVKRDVISFEEYNPYVTGAMLQAVDILHTLQEQDPDATVFTHNKTLIRSAALQRGIKFYNKAIVAALGAMLSKGSPNPHHSGDGQWLDVGGQYITRRETEAILAAVDSGELTTTEAVDNRFRSFAVHYDDYAHSWAKQIYAALLGHTPTADEIAEAVAAGSNAHASMRRTTDADRDRDQSLNMAVSYGLDATSEEERREDYYAVRGLK